MDLTPLLSGADPSELCFDAHVEVIEREVLSVTLKRHGGNKRAAAQVYLDMAKDTKNSVEA